ncbi:elongation factor 1-gamma [Ceratobasidium sp. AG-Ba]|nr:elongation factor 1-gamma [Ceratobasidium sp. AG-Ba]
MSIGTLYTVDVQPHAKRIRATAAVAGLKLDEPTGYVHYETNKTPEYQAKFANGKIPALETPDGFCLFEGSAIARYVASLAPNSGLLGTSPTDAALVDQWVSFLDSEIASRSQMLRGMLSGRAPFPYFKPLDTSLREAILRHIGILNTYLTHNTFLLPTNRLSLADISFAAVLSGPLDYLLDAKARAEYPAVVRLFETVVNQPAIKDIFGEIKYAETALQYVAPKKEKAPAPPAAAAAPKAPKEKKPAADDDEPEPDVPAEPKAKNPLDDLPKSEFNLEDWKRAYSNMDTRGPGGALEWFYQKFDPAGFSIWRVDFKYNEELTLTFMSSNQIGGFFNRLEASRKYLFGSVGVLGETNNSRISGVLILRGLDHKPVVEVAPDWESYEYKKIDLENPEDKAFFEGALAWDLEVDGKKWADGKNFK